MKFIDETKLSFEFETTPFQHVVIDGFIKEDYFAEILQEMDKLTLDKTYYFPDQNIEKNKYAFKDFTGILMELFQEMNGEEFVSFLEKKTGIEGIIRNNNTLQGAGVHKILNEGFLCMHTDFDGYTDNLHGLLDRRMNLLLYMNPEWKQEYGGELCLYDRNVNKITKTILPILNRCVIFLTPGSIHGHPNPLNIPENKVRQSITNYYYTKNVTGKSLEGSEMLPVMWYHGIKL